jgi:hypothetical protein
VGGSSVGIRDGARQILGAWGSWAVGSAGPGLGFRVGDRIKLG